MSDMYCFKRVLCLFFLLFGLAFLPINAVENYLLRNCMTFSDLSSAICMNQSWVDYPAYEDREGWKRRVEPSIRNMIIRNGEKALQYEWKPDLASDYLAFKRTGERRTVRVNHRMLQALVLAELVEGKKRFMDAIIDGVWFLCETPWISSAHLFFQQDQSGLPDKNEPTIDLYVADIGAQMAWLHYFFKKEFDKVSPLIDKKIVEEVKKRLIAPYFMRNDYWWMGFTREQVNNWNPWINYNVLQTLMLVEDNPQRIKDGVWKLMNSVDFFFSMYRADGACDEGPTYWSGASGYALKFLDLLHKVTAGKVDVFKNQLLRNMGQYIYKVHIGKTLFVNFADSSPKVTPSASILFHYGKRIEDEKMMEFAAFIAHQNSSLKNSLNGPFAVALDELLMHKEIMNYPQRAPLIGDFWFKDTQICVARDKAGESGGFFFAAKGGHNKESHNHNDVGSCILYYDNTPLLVDVGVGVYTRQTFGPERYSIWTMRSSYHNLPTINGVEQKNGKEFSAGSQRYKTTSQEVFYQLNIANAYPQEAGAKKWVRSYTLQRAKRFVIEDSWELSLRQNSFVLNLMTYCPVEIDEKQNVSLLGEFGRLRLEYDKRLFVVETDVIRLTDVKLKRGWDGKNITRIRLIMTKQIAKGCTKVIIQK